MTLCGPAIEELALALAYLTIHAERGVNGADGLCSAIAPARGEATGRVYPIVHTVRERSDTEGVLSDRFSLRFPLRSALALVLL